MGSKKRWIMGKNCILEVARYHPEKVIRIFCSHQKEVAQLQKEFPIDYVSKEKLTKMIQSDSHQGYIAEIKVTNEQSLEHLIKSCRNTGVILMVDSVADPQNLGAILRTAECFGVDGVILPKNRGCTLTPTVSKVSMGAQEHLNIVIASNLHQAVLALKKEGFFIYAAENHSKAMNLCDVSFPPKIVIIVGSEGEGTRNLLLKSADVLVKIPLFGVMNSLNVAQATSVLLYQVKMNAKLSNSNFE